MSHEFVNMVKLCVGVSSVEELERWQKLRVESGIYSAPEHVTRSTPRRSGEILNGGSLYWVIRGKIRARQRVIGLDPRVGQDGIVRCAIVFDRAIIRTVQVPRKPFQGWRYLEAKDSPRDLFRGERTTEGVPAHVQEILLEIGVV